MELLALLIIIITLCLILDISVLRILIGALLIMGLVTLSMILLFVFFFLQLLFTKRKKARFLRISRSDHYPFQVAYYQIGDAEYPCVFPAEMVLQDKLYRKDQTCHVFLNQYIGQVYDRYATTTCILGTLLSIGAVAIMTELVRELLA